MPSLSCSSTWSILSTRTPVRASPRGVAVLESAISSWEAASWTCFSLCQSGTRKAAVKSSINSEPPTITASSQSRGWVFMEMNRLCAVSMTPKIKRTSVPPT